MKKNFVSLKKVLASVIITGGSCLLYSTIVPPTTPVPQQSCVVSQNELKGWFTSQNITLNGSVDPANSVTFTNAVNNCIFYKWSEQMFLWLTSPAPASYGCGAHVFESKIFYDVSPLDANKDRTFLPHQCGVVRKLLTRDKQMGPNGLPIIIDKAGRLLEVEKPKTGPTGKRLILNDANKAVEIKSVQLDNTGKPVFKSADNKIIQNAKMVVRPEINNSLVVHKFIIGKQVVFLDQLSNIVDVEEGQADGSALIAQNNSLVYYATSVNDVYAYFLTGVKKGLITPGTQFPTTQTQLNQVITYATAHNKTIPDPTALAIEVKTSWIEAAGLPNLSSYITEMAEITTYDKTNPKIWKPNGKKKALMAMVGMHVVGSVKGHPEMVWATFEHNTNAPNAQFAYTTQTAASQNVPQNTAGNWLFCANGSAGPFNINAASVDPATGNIVGPGGGASNIAKSDIIRWKPWGAASNGVPNPLVASAAQSNSEVISINNSILNQLISGDVRRNYIMTGATWTIGGAAPSSSNQVGTSRLANATLETFDQGTNTTTSGGFSSNCFSCHSTNTTAVSHVFFTPGTSNTRGLKPLPGF